MADTAEIDLDRIHTLAEAILPGLITEHGRDLSTQTIADYAEEHLTLTDGDMELLVDQVKDLAPAYAAPAEQLDKAVRAFTGRYDLALCHLIGSLKAEHEKNLPDAATRIPQMITTALEYAERRSS
jgi:hypothetical protein